METINLHGFQYVGPDSVERVTRAFKPILQHLDQTPAWFQSNVILPAFAQGRDLPQIVRGLTQFVQSIGGQVQGADNIRSAS